MGKGSALRIVLSSDDTDLSRRRSWALGFIISVLGSATFGVLNMVAIQLTIERNWQSALWFSFGCVLVETVFVRYSVVFTKWISRNPKTKKVFEWGALVLFIILSFVCFSYNSSAGLNFDRQLYEIPAFFLGVVMRLLYPSMIPFWLGWNAALISQEVVFKPIPFAVAAGLGTFIMHAAYIYAGQFALDFLEGKSEFLMWGLGILLLITAVLHGRRMLSKKVRQPLF